MFKLVVGTTLDLGDICKTINTIRKLLKLLLTHLKVYIQFKFVANIQTSYMILRCCTYIFYSTFPTLKLPE